MTRKRIAVLFLFAITVVYFGTGRSTRIAIAADFSAACDVGSLKQAIIDANASGGPDVVTLTADCVYTLTVVDNTEFDDSTNGLPLITEELLIEGKNATIERSTEDGTPAFRILRSNAGTLTVRDLTIRNGKVEVADTARGGGVRTSAALVIENSVVVGNSVKAPFAGGGGAFASTTLTTTNTTFSGNSVTATLGGGSGGGSLSFGMTTATNSTFDANSVTGTSTVSGGGSASESELNVLNSTYSGNSVKGPQGGGGGTNSLGLTTVTNSTFAGNDATAATAGAGMSGGGSYSNAGLIVTNSTYFSNFATSPSGPRGGGTFSFDDSTISFSTYEANVAYSADVQAEGGGAYALGALTATNSTFSGNSASGGATGVPAGGGTFSVDPSFVANSTYRGNSAGGNVTARGGGFFVVTTMGMTNSIVSGSTNDDCRSLDGITANEANIDSDGTCDNAQTFADPGLLPLALNAPGTTKTFSLEMNSPARNIGVACEATDQRGVARPQGPACDAGAYEAGAALLPFDVDCDSDEDSIDALAVMHAIAGIASLPQPQGECDADVDNDLDIDVADVVATRRRAAGL